MTRTEYALVELNRDIRAALADWEGAFTPITKDVLCAVVAGERMAGVLTRIQVLSDMLLEQRNQTKEKGKT